MIHKRGMIVFCVFSYRVTQNGPRGNASYSFNTTGILLVFFVFFIFFKLGDKTNCALLGVGKALVSLTSFISFHGGVSQFYKVFCC